MKTIKPTTPNSESIKAVTYARVSSDEQEKTGFSIPAQMKLLHEYAERKGYVIEREFIDVETAKRAGRTNFIEMLKFLRKNNLSCRTILVEKTDRLYRNLKDWITIEDLDIELHLVKESEIISRTSHSSHKMTHGIKVVMAKYHIDNLSEETKKGLRQKAEEGFWPGVAPYGYLNISEASGKKIIVPDETVAAQILWLFEAYRTGRYSLKELTLEARSAGMIYRHTKLPLKKSHVHKILRNKVYYGDFDFNGKAYVGKHIPIVGIELWQEVQEVLDRKFAKRHRKIIHTFAYSGLVRCKHCDGALIGTLKKGRYTYYHCAGGKACGERYVREEVLSGKFVDVLSRLSLDPKILKWVSLALLESHAEERKFHEGAITRLQQECSRIQGRLETLYTDRLERRIEPDFYDQKANEFRSQQDNLRRDIARHEGANRGYIDTGVKILELASRAAELFLKQDSVEKRRLLQFVLWNSVFGEGELQVEFRQPFDLIMDANQAQRLDAAELDVEKTEMEVWGG